MAGGRRVGGGGGGGARGLGGLIRVSHVTHHQMGGGSETAYAT